MIYNNILELIGKTPIVKLNSINTFGTEILVKLESFNPGGSVKDRIAKNMIESAEKQGLINKNTMIIEPTSGNTGVGLAMTAAAKGYKLILTMPDTMSIERRNLLKAYGAELVLTDGKLGMKGAIDKAIELNETYENSIILQQFENPANPDVHRKTTAIEILENTEKNIDIFVAGVGTGGTVTGTGEILKKEIPTIKVIAVEPENSAVLSGNGPGPHKIQGIGAGFIPKVLNTDVFDEVIQVSNEESFKHARLLAQKEGILAGISSGAALAAALKLAQKEENKGKKILVILPDTGERYLSTGIFE
ncbi:cysteine synthase A [Hypnocyclicus thermotrophus]|uniref:Cysteine synthase n=1 Tax=Hypnocyclicus thermotrophus TaxID=1627895 RepID=A0AA46DZC1_9FUSO|nr:cysteine synthase A [Hypnocyclicus thermotrophus]TDT71585.1 cysteine synthase A [Hypnocyclicus thermotrophus]